MMTITETLEPHPNIVRFVGAITNGFQKRDIYIVMKLCEHGSLKEYLISHRRDLVLTNNETQTQTISPIAYKWSWEIAQGMKFLTDNKILHIDLATRNILLTKENVAKISDFGFSRTLYARREYYRGRGGTNFHTSWKAPEALKLRGGIFSSQSEVWSYGVTLWEIFALGCEPNYKLDADIQLELERGTRLEPPPFWDKETKTVMKECWNQDPEFRPTFQMLQDFFVNKLKEVQDTSVSFYRDKSTMNPVNVTRFRI